LWEIKIKGRKIKEIIHGGWSLQIKVFCYSNILLLVIEGGLFWFLEAPVFHTRREILLSKSL